MVVFLCCPFALPAACKFFFAQVLFRTWLFICRLFENFLKNFFEAGLSSENSKKRPASRNGPAGRRNVLWIRLLTWYSSYSKPDDSDGGATLFLAGADHGYCEREKRTRQNNLQSATVSLQVVIGLCVGAKKRRLWKSKPPLQMGVSIWLLYDGFFSFAVVWQLFLSVLV